MTSAPLPDAKPSNWVDALAPAPWRKWLKLGRFDRPAGIWLLMLPGWCGAALAAAQSGRWPDLKILILFALGSALMRAAGCAFNDIADRDLDKKVFRTASRPVASGAISVKAAFGFIGLLCAISLMILLQFNPATLILGVASLALVAIYPFMKRITWWPQAWLGLTFNWGALMAYAAARGGLEAPALILYAALIFWTLGYDTLYALQDIEDDALAGVKSSARRLARAVLGGVRLFYGLCAALCLTAVWTAHLGPLAYAGVAVFGLHLGWQTRGKSPLSVESALNRFRSNREAGLILFFGLIFGALA